MSHATRHPEHHGGPRRPAGHDEVTVCLSSRVCRYLSKVLFQIVGVQIDIHTVRHFSHITRCRALRFQDPLRRQRRQEHAHTHTHTKTHTHADRFSGKGDFVVYKGRRWAVCRSGRGLMHGACNRDQNGYRSPVWTNRRNEIYPAPDKRTATAAGCRPHSNRQPWRQ